MILILKKWNLLLIFAIFAVSVFALQFGAEAFFAAKQVSLPCYGKTVVIDAGHGEPDGGTVGISGVEEQDLNLQIAKFLQGFLEQSGMDVVMTRVNREGLQSGGKTVREQKRSDLANREKMMNRSDAELFVSIHMNQFSDSKYSGPQVFYSKNDERSKLAAELLQKELIATLAPPSEREIKAADSGIYLLHHAKKPAVLVECGFLSNRAEEEKLRQENYQKEVAWAIYSGIVQYFATED